MKRRRKKKHAVDNGIEEAGNKASLPEAGKDDKPAARKKKRPKDPDAADASGQPVKKVGFISLSKRKHS